MVTAPNLRWLAVALLLLALVLGSGGFSDTRHAAPAPPAPTAGSPFVRPVARPYSPGQASSATNDSWVELAPAASALTARSQAAMASDPSLGGIVLFGGYDPGSATALSDTWLFSNGSWSDLGAPFLNVPPARWGATLVFDPADGYLVLFGGRDSTTTFSDTWELSATNARSWYGWTQLTPTTAPSPRAFAPAFYDPSTTSIIVFGGGCTPCPTSGAWAANNETWSFSGGTWSNDTGAAGPSPGALMGGYAAWDPALDGGVYFAGQDASNNCTSNRTTWLYHGTWTSLVTNGTPSLAAGGGMVWYSPEAELVLFGGLKSHLGGCVQDSKTTWVLQNYTWTDISNASNAITLIGPRCCEGVATDPFGQVVVAFGGNSQNATYYNQTWTYPALPFVVNVSGGTRGISGVTVISFSASAMGGVAPYSFNWSFGDGTPNATAQNASHVYNSPGSYLATGQVADGAGRITLVRLPVSIAPSLSLNATAGSLTGDAPFPVRFNATGTGGFHPYAWTWAFGDGFSWNGPNVTHTYSIEGTFNVTLWLNDSYGEHTTAHFVAVVHGRLVVTISASATSLLAPTDVNFSALVQGGTSPFEFLWTFEAGATAAGQQANHSFAAPGTYNVTLVVTDGLGTDATDSVTVDVYAHLSASAEVSDPVAIAPATETFTALSLGGAPPLYYTWNFGDQTPAVPGLTTMHQYFQGGNYTVRLTVTDSLGESVNTTLAVEIVRPLFVVAATNSTQGPAPFSVLLTAVTTGGLAPLAFLWAFGDGTSGIGPDQTHTYGVGHFTATVTATDNAGENVSSNVVLVVYLALGVSVTASPSTIELGNVTTLTASLSGGVAPTTLTWIGLPPGCYSRNAATIDCLPTTSGSFTVIVQAADAAHEDANATLTLAVTPINATACCGPGEQPAGLSSSEITGIAVGLLAAVAVAVAMILRRRRPPDSTPDPESISEPDLPESSDPR